MSPRGKGQRGMANHRAVFTDDNIRMIRKDPRNNTELAEAMGVCNQTISDIRNRKTWAHIDPEVNTETSERLDPIQ